MNRILRLLPAALALAALSTISAAEPPAQLISSAADAVNPNPTFTLRFAKPMVDAASVGKVADPAPVELQPAVKGTFTWLSTRSGVFAPAEPLPLSSTFRFIFREGTKNAGGEALREEFDATFQTPPMTLKGSHTTTGGYEDDARVLPEFQLLFNADVAAAEAAPFLTFTNKEGQKIAAAVTQSDTKKQRFPNYRASDRSLLTWKARFFEKVAPATGMRLQETPRPIEESRQNQITVRPAEPLSVGSGWKLVVGDGLPSTEPGVTMLQAQEIAIGRVRAFEFGGVEAVNDGQGAKRLLITFTKPLAPSITAENVLQWIKVTPVPKKLETSVSGSSVTLSGAFQLGTEYKIAIAAGLSAAEPFALPQGRVESATFEPIAPSLVLEGFATHQLSSGTRHFHMQAVNVPKIRVTAKLFQPDTAPLALKTYTAYVNPPNAKDDEFHRKIDPSKLPGKTIYSRVITGTEQIDTERDIKLAWNDILGAGKNGVVLITAEEVGKGRRPGVQAIVQVTDLGVVWKGSANETFVHVFSLATGAPLAGVKMDLVADDHTKLGTATTDATGTALLPAATKAHWLRAERGADLHLVPLDDDSNDLSLYRFKIPFRDEESGDENVASRQVLMFTERGVYRPGETVHLKGIIRDPRGGQARIPAGTKARLKAFDDREREIFTRDVTVSEFGSIDADIPLPKGTLGTYSAVLNFGKEGDQESVASHEFEVQEYTPNAFEISIGGPKTVVGAQPLELPIAGKYLMGKSLSQAELTWSIEAEDKTFKPEGFDDFNFGDAIDDYRLNRALDRASHFADQGKLELGEDGKAAIVTAVQINTKAPQPRHARLLCEVTDLNQQTVSQASELTFHSSDFYLGIGKLPEVVQKGDSLPLPLVAVRTDGTLTPEPVAAKLRVTRIDWQNNRVVTDDDATETETEPIFKKITEQEFQTQRAAMREHQWQPLGEPANLVAGDPGLYMLEAFAKDVAGREVITSTTFYVTGENVTEWNYRNEFQIELISDKLEHLSGETARILVKTPIAGDALVTVERDKVLRSFKTKLTGNAPSVEIPLVGLDAPNVFVSVMLLRGANDSPRKFKEPDYRVGFCQLKVTRPESKLSVYVSPERKGYQPGETVTISAEVRDILGKARAGAEVTLYAVDEGVLSLTGYETPDPLKFFNVPLPLSVTTSLTLPTLLSEDPEEKSFENKGYMIGGGGDAGDAFRKNFITCALWNANLRTDENGRVSASFTAPDSLTRYRVIAVVQTKDDAFGAGESAFEVSKPVMLEPALPRFANVSDKLSLRAVLHNLTDVAGEVEVQLALDETATGTNLTRRVELGARKSLAVDFPVEFKAVGEAKWKWTARFTGADHKTAYRDAVQTTLKVGFPVAELREVRLQRVDQSEANLLRGADPMVLEGQGIARVSLGNSRVIELRESLNQLLHYPYGCVEQTTSSTLPWIVLQDFRGTLPELARSDEQIRDAVNHGVDRLFTMQTSCGGLSYWPGGRDAHFQGSAYAGLGLAMAKRAGYTVPAEPFDLLCKYLSATLRGSATTENRWELGERCLAAYTLALAGRAEPAYHELLFQKRDRLTGEARAMLALAIIESKGQAAMTEELLKPLKAEGSEEDPFWSNSRDAAIRLLAWSQFRPNGPEVETTATELLGRREGGHWMTTQGNAWSLIAFSNYVRNVEKPAPQIDATVAWGGKSEKVAIDLKSPLRRLEFPIAKGADRLPMTIANPGEHRIFTEVELVAHPRTLKQPRVNQGYGIERNYAKVEDDGSLTDLKNPQVGDRVLVTLKIDVPRNARYVAVNDPMPSIFEAVNPVFKSQATRAGEVLGQGWPGDFQELRDDRALFFADYLYRGQYTIRYLARVRAAGTATAPSAKIEEMYHPERFGLTETMQLTSLPLK